MGSVTNIFQCEQTLIRSRMKIFLFIFALFLFFTETNSDFAADLATFINETPAGYTVTQQLRGGNTCHCRVPASSSSSSSSADPTTTAAPTTTVPTTAYTTGSASYLTQLAG